MRYQNHFLLLDIMLKQHWHDVKNYLMRLLRAATSFHACRLDCGSQLAFMPLPPFGCVGSFGCVPDGGSGSFPAFGADEIGVDSFPDPPVLFGNHPYCWTSPRRFDQVVASLALSYRGCGLKYCLSFRIIPCILVWCGGTSADPIDDRALSILVPYIYIQEH